MFREIAIRAQHFEEGAQREAAREIFRDSVTNVVVEIFSRCNRQCAYCPVSLVDRLSSNKIMDGALFELIVSNLAEINYSGKICLNLYNEPLSDRDVLLPAMAALRKAVPQAWIYLNSNGDYLTAEYLDDLVAAGCNEMHVTLHPPKDTAYSDLYCLGRFTDLSARIGVGAKFTSFASGHEIRATMKYKGMVLHVFSVNYTRYGNTRGNLMDSVSRGRGRRSPCDRVFCDFTISYDGTVVPCCQIFIDKEEHKKYAIGNLSAFGSIFEAYASRRFAEWRKGLLGFGEKAPPCDTCSECDDSVSPESEIEHNNKYAEFLGAVPLADYEDGDGRSERRGWLKNLVGKIL